MSRRVFVIHAIGVSQAADLAADRIDVYGRALRRVHLRGERKPIWVDAAQIRDSRYGAEEGRRLARAYSQRFRVGMTVVDAVVELDRLATGELPHIDTALINDLVGRWRSNRGSASTERRAA